MQAGRLYHNKRSEFHRDGVAIATRNDILLIWANNHLNLRAEAMKKEEILQKLAAGELEVGVASQMLAELEQPKRGSLYCKVSQKGALSVYGLQRMPVTLYVEQWDRLLGFADEIKEFLKEHDSELKRKEK
jgi:hypothetical protein